MFDESERMARRRNSSVNEIKECTLKRRIWGH